MTAQQPRVLRSGWSALALVMTAGWLLAACGGSPGPSITLYNGQHEQTTESLVTAFEKATGITVNIRSDDEDTLADEIVSEGSRSPADVIYTENSPALEYLQSKGLLAAVEPSTLAATPSRYSSPQDDWVGVSARVSVLIYNPSLISESQLPTSILQLADPRYQGELALAPGETDFQPIVTSVARAYGAAAALTWLEGLRTNAGSHVYPDNETIAADVNRGEVAFGVVNQYYWYRLAAEIGSGNIHSAIAYFAAGDPFARRQDAGDFRDAPAPVPEAPTIFFGNLTGCFTAPNFSAAANRIILEARMEPTEKPLAFIDLSHGLKYDGNPAQYVLLTSYRMIVRNALNIVAFLWFTDLGQVGFIDRLTHGKPRFWRSVLKTLGIEPKYSLVIGRHNGSHFHTIASEADDRVKKVIYNFLLKQKSQPDS